MSGQLAVGGSPSAPAVTGGFTMRRGTFSLGSRRLTFSKGVVTLDNLNTIDPRLDFLATTTANSATIGVAITGTAREPKLEITSTPSMPPDEAMALLIFGKPASQLGASELVQVAQALIAQVGDRLSTAGACAGVDRDRHQRCTGGRDIAHGECGSERVV